MHARSTAASGTQARKLRRASLTADRQRPIELSGEIDRLYGLPLGEFTPERQALAKRLRESKAKEAAAEVGRLAKPSVVAWGMNQLARRDRNAAAALLEAGAALRAAQEGLIAGRADWQALQEAEGSLRTAVAKARDRAAAILAEAGHGSPSVGERLRDSLRAAAIDAEAGELLADGRLVREPSLSDVGLFAGAAVAKAPPLPRTRAAEQPAPAGDDLGQRRRIAEVQKELAASRAEEAAGQRALEDLARRAQGAEARRDDAQREYEAAAADVTRLTGEREAAEGRLAGARARRERAEDAARDLVQ